MHSTSAVNLGKLCVMTALTGEGPERWMKVNNACVGAKRESKQLNAAIYKISKYLGKMLIMANASEGSLSSLASIPLNITS